MHTRTDHARQIAQLRSAGDTAHEDAKELTQHLDLDDTTTLWRYAHQAAAELLQMHDDTGISLDHTPALSSLVTYLMGRPPTPNGA